LAELWALDGNDEESSVHSPKSKGRSGAVAARMPEAKWQEIATQCGPEEI
jgi:hypothetical protein